MDSNPIDTSQMSGRASASVRNEYSNALFGYRPSSSASRTNNQHVGDVLDRDRNQKRGQFSFGERGPRFGERISSRVTAVVSPLVGKVCGQPPALTVEGLSVQCQSGLRQIGKVHSADGAVFEASPSLIAGLSAERRQVVILVAAHNAIAGHPQFRFHRKPRRHAVRFQNSADVNRQRIDQPMKRKARVNPRPSVIPIQPAVRSDVMSDGSQKFGEVFGTHVEQRRRRIIRPDGAKQTSLGQSDSRKLPPQDAWHEFVASPERALHRDFQLYRPFRASLPCDSIPGATLRGCRRFALPQADMFSPLWAF